MLGTLVIFTSYCLYVYNVYPDRILNAEVDFSFWGAVFLILIPVTIAAKIVIHIIFAIAHKVATDEELPELEDERDKLIELKATRNSHYAFGAGFLLAMSTLVMDLPPYTMFLVLFFAGFFSEIISCFTALHFYRRGF